ncbi:MAG: type I methionyl aminopeptidase [Proteobacteria bacterium]|nr:type I methionyl aminopeptidase [Pseudomonadota bacterium]
MIEYKSDKEVALIRESGRITAQTLDLLERSVRPGISTLELDRIAEDFIRSAGAVPAFKGYKGFPRTVCISVNNEVVHGIPGNRKLKDGDIVGLDMGVIWKGWYSDSARTVAVGSISEDARRLLDVTRDSLMRGIERCTAGNHLSDIGAAVQQHAEAHGYSVVRDLVGHGIGRALHEEPQVPNYGRPGHGLKLRPGLVIAIEPMVNVGDFKVAILPDKWTIVTEDGSLSAHFEHTVAITGDGPRILTLSEGD